MVYTVNDNTMLLLFCILSVLASSVLTQVESSSVVVESPFGKIRGAKLKDEITGQSYLFFRGIPYAKPPLGDLRLAKPQPHPKIDGIFDASKEAKISCPHPSFMTFNETNFSEDCLILNIQTKDVQSSNALRKVIVFIHGGGFIFGSSSYCESKSFVIKQDVVVVTINYRLGILGFLSTENEASRGNYGLWDQTLAIKWVKDNIRAFGGDPDDITIAGESAGGASVGYQVLSPHTKGLFSKANLQSGTASAVFGRAIGAQSHALKLAKSAGCWEKGVDSKIGFQESRTLVDCLRKAPLSAFTDFNDFILSQTQFVPVVDGDFVPDIPVKLLKDDKYLEHIGFFDLSFLISITNNEAGIMSGAFKMIKNSISGNEKLSEDEKESAYKSVLADTKKLYVNSRLGEDDISHDSAIMSKIDDFYGRRFLDDNVVVEMVSDLCFLIPSLDFLAAASRRESCSSYFLLFDHFPYFTKGESKGSPHALDLLYWFDMEVSQLERYLNLGMQGEFAEDDLELKRMFSTIIGDFVKTGNPGISLKSIIPSGWPKYDVTNSYYLKFNSKPWISSFLEKDKQDFWFDTLPSLLDNKSPVHSEL